MSSDRILRALLVGVGALAVARGAWLVLVGLPPRVWLPITVWLAAGSVVHDLVLAPASLLLGRLTARWGHPVVLRVGAGALRGAWLGLGTVVLITVPLLVGAGRRANPSVIPGRPVLNLVLSLALVAAGALAVVVVNLVRLSRAGRATRAQGGGRAPTVP